MKKREKSPLISKTPAESYAGDILVLPIAILAFWTLAHQLMLIVRWPAKTITWCFLALALTGFFFLARFWNKTNATRGKGYRFHLSHLFFPDSRSWLRNYNSFCASDLEWLTLLGIPGVGLSNIGLYAIPALICCSWIALFTLQLFQHKTLEDVWKQVRRGLLLAIPLVYPIAILASLKLDIIPKPIDINSLGPRYMPWREAVDRAIGGRRSICAMSYL